VLAIIGAEVAACQLIVAAVGADNLKILKKSYGYAGRIPSEV